MQIDELARQIDAASSTILLAAVIDSGDVAASIGRLSLMQLRDVIKTLVDVRVLPAGKGVRFDLEQVAFEWRQA